MYDIFDDTIRRVVDDGNQKSDAVACADVSVCHACPYMPVPDCVHAWACVGTFGWQGIHAKLRTGVLGREWHRACKGGALWKGVTGVTTTGVWGSVRADADGLSTAHGVQMRTVVLAGALCCRQVRRQVSCHIALACAGVILLLRLPPSPPCMHADAAVPAFPRLGHPVDHLGARLHGSQPVPLASHPRLVAPGRSLVSPHASCIDLSIGYWLSMCTHAHVINEQGAAVVSHGFCACPHALSEPACTRIDNKGIVED